ncbi:cytochrome P450 76T24-like [Bidens hawaiensis]|uniref:cytochrome P450 76T24-like n=1 Tax=Bidens hawaiensis TaxID=980011 RepID=UPI00404A80AF
MDTTTFLLMIPLLLTVFCVFTISRSRNPRLPPGPYPFPVIGNLLQLGNKPHRSLAALSKRYGPLMLLKLGSRTTLVISSPDMAKEFFHKHDQSFSSRSVPEIVRLNNHNESSIVWLPAEYQWRRLRRITKECLFSGQSLDASEQLRRQKVHELVDHVRECCRNEKAVNIGAVAFTTTLNIISNLLFSSNFSQYDLTSSQEIHEVISGLLEVAGKPNLVDFFPILRPLDPQGLASQVHVYFDKLFAIFDNIIDQRLQRRAVSSSYDTDLSTQHDVLDLLLDINFKDDHELSINDMKSFFMDLLVAGSDTVSITLEWAMTELIRNPKKLETARIELMKHMHNNDKTLNEHNIPQLPYLQAIIKETLRLHPPGPFLVPHQATHDVEVEGFIVPKDAQILCNVWAIGRDPKVWSNANVFMPERFLEAKTDYRGQDFELIPFGAGRRSCPGLNLARRELHTILVSLIYNFDWKLEGNMRAQDLDMEEKFGLSLPRNVPLMAIPIDHDRL